MTGKWGPFFFFYLCIKFDNQLSLQINIEAFTPCVFILSAMKLP